MINQPFQSTKSIPDDKEQLKEYFKIHLKCPIPIEKNEKYHILKDELLWLWKKVCSSLAVDNEDVFIYDDNNFRDLELDEQTYEDLKWDAINLSTWIDKAKEEFIEKTSTVTALVADLNVYKKHYLTKNINLNDIKTLAKRNNISYFFTDITPRKLEIILLNTIKPFFQEITSTRKIRYAVICSRNVGITSQGKATHVIMIEIDATSSTAHAYPCSLIEASTNVKIMKRKVRNEIDYWWNGNTRDPEAESDIKLICSIDLDEIVK